MCVMRQSECVFERCSSPEPRLRCLARCTARAQLFCLSSREENLRPQAGRFRGRDGGCRLPVARCRCGAGRVCGVAKQSPGAARPAGSRVAVGPGGLWGQVAPRAAANAGEERSDEGAQDIGCELGVVGAAVPKRVGEGQDPLPDGDMGEYAVDEVGCGVGRG